MEWCKMKVATVESFGKSEGTCVDGIDRKMPSVWNSSISREERKGEIIFPVSVSYPMKPIKTRSYPDSVWSYISGCYDSLKNHNIDVKQHSSYRDFISGTPEDEIQALFQYLDTFKPIALEGNKMVPATKLSWMFLMPKISHTYYC